MTKKKVESADALRKRRLQDEASKRTKYERTLDRKKGSPYCRTRSAQGPTVLQYRTASPASSVWHVQQQWTSSTAPKPTKAHDSHPLHTANSSGSQPSLPSLKSSSEADNALQYGKRNAESPPATPPRPKSKAEPNDHPIVCTWYVQDLHIDYEWHNSYGIVTEADTQCMVPPAKKLTEQEARTIPYVITESEYLIQQGLITGCDGESIAFYWLGTSPSDLSHLPVNAARI